MRFLFRSLFAIATLQSGPQVLPASPVLLGLTVGLDIALGAVAVSLLNQTANIAAVLAIALLGLAFAYLALYLRGVPERFAQTATALFGTDLLISLVALPLAAPAAAQMNADAAPPVWLSFALLAVVGWSIAVLTGIFRHALDFPRAGAFLVALAYFFVTSGVVF